MTARENVLKATVDTFEHKGRVIACLVDVCCFTRYLELGIDQGTNLREVVERCPRLQIAVGVDINAVSFPALDRVRIYSQTSTDQFFSRNEETFDCIFIDACHDYPQVISDFRNAMKILEDDGLIFLHDTYPPYSHWSGGRLCSDAYKAYFEISTMVDVCECVTLPLFCGLTIVRKRDGNKKLQTELS